jgi:predicted glycosyltransferase
MTPGRPPRLLFVSNEIIGLGHLRIALRLSACIQAELADASILLLTASPMTHAFPLPPGLEVVKIPGVVRSSEVLTAYASARLPLAFREVKKLRERIIRETARAYQPDLCLVDYRPAGVDGELLPTLRMLRRQGQTALVLLLRDILDDPAIVRARWRADRALPTLEGLYDEIWVYGCQSLYDPIKEYGFSDAVGRKVRFCGYLDVEPPAACPAETRRALGVADERIVLVTIGNGRVGFPVLDASVSALAQLPEELDLVSLVVGGPELPFEQREVIRRRCAASDTRHPRRRATFVDFSPRLLDYMAAADVVVSLAGYNTMTEVLTLEKRAVVVPYAQGHREQVMRAALLERLGLIRTVPPDQLSPERLAGSLVSALQDSPPTRQRAHQVGFEFGGLRRIRDHVVRLLGRVDRPPSRPDLTPDRLSPGAPVRARQSSPSPARRSRRP